MKSKNVSKIINEKFIKKMVQSIVREVEPEKIYKKHDLDLLISSLEENGQTVPPNLWLLPT